MSIHPTALVEDGANLAKNVVVGPFCYVGPNVTLDQGVKRGSHVVVGGDTHIGAETEVFSFACLGLQPQDLKYEGEAVSLNIGKNCIIRENVTMHPGTAGGGYKTVVGDQCAFLAGSHVAHDCMIGDGVILSNNVMLAGHVSVGDRVIFGGGSAVHQFARIGTGAFVGGLAGVEHDLLPFAIAIGHRAEVAGPNVVGLRRAGFQKSDIHRIREVYRMLFETEKTMKMAINDVEAFALENESPLVSAILEFVQQDTSRTYCTMRRKG